MSNIKLEDDGIIYTINGKEEIFEDAMPLPCDELINLYKAWKSNNIWGSAIWCCKRRNEQPQAPVKQKMIDLGIWTE